MDVRKQQRNQIDFKQLFEQLNEAEKTLHMSNASAELDEINELQRFIARLSAEPVIYGTASSFPETAYEVSVDYKI